MEKLGQIVIPTAGYLETFHSQGISGDGINTPLGIDTNVYTPYNETVLWQKPSTGWFTGTKIEFSEPISSFQRLMFIHDNSECPLVKFYGIPGYSDSNFMFYDCLGNSTASKMIRYHIYKMNGWSEMNFSAQMGMGKNTTNTEVETYAYLTGAQTGAHILNGYLTEIRGINRK